jgi:hypothetical protein
MISERSRQIRSPHEVSISEPAAVMLTRRFLIDPFTDQTVPNLSALTDDEDLALHSIAKAMGRSVTDVVTSLELRPQVLHLLNRSMQAKALDADRSRAAKEALGNAGLLSPSLYTLQFGDLVKEFIKLGERPENIASVVRSPDVVQHLAPPGGAIPNADESQSIFVREIRPKKKTYFLQMVTTRRQGSLLTFCAAWRFYREFISWDGSMSPVDLLQRFVDRYGIPFSISGSRSSKFVLNESIDLDDSTKVNLQLNIEGRQPSHDEDIIAQVAIKSDSERKKLHLSMGYVIDAAKYARDMQSVK